MSRPTDENRRGKASDMPIPMHLRVPARLEHARKTASESADLSYAERRIAHILRALAEADWLAKIVAEDEGMPGDSEGFARLDATRAWARLAEEWARELADWLELPAYHSKALCSPSYSRRPIILHPETVRNLIRELRYCSDRAAADRIAGILAAADDGTVSELIGKLEHPSLEPGLMSMGKHYGDIVCEAVWRELRKYLRSSPNPQSWACQPGIPESRPPCYAEPGALGVSRLNQGIPDSESDSEA